MPDYKCEFCGEEFALAQEVLDRYPGWKPRWCRRHKGGKAAVAKRVGGGRSGGRRGGRGGGASRGGSAREENLQLADAMRKYAGAGPQDGVFTDGSCSPNPGPGGWGVAWLEGTPEPGGMTLRALLPPDLIRALV